MKRQRALEGFVYICAFVGRMLASITERQYTAYCGMWLSLVLRFLANGLIFYLMALAASLVAAALTQGRLQAFTWNHPWTLHARFSVYLLVLCSLPSCFLSEAILMLWRYH